MGHGTLYHYPTRYDPFSHRVDWPTLTLHFITIMNPFHLISRSALHIFSCRRLLAWNLLTCCICISCITEVKYGYTDIQNKKEETSSDIAKVCKKSEATELHFACAHRDLKQVRKLLSKGADPNVQDPSGCTPFQLAILHFIKKVKKKALNKTQLDILSHYKKNQWQKTLSKLTGRYQICNNASKIIQALLDSSTIKLSKQDLTCVFSFGHELLTLEILEHRKFQIDQVDLYNTTLIEKLNRLIIKNTKDLPNLKKRQGLNLLGLVIKEYGKNRSDSKINIDLKNIMTKLLAHYPKKAIFNEAKTGNNDLHFIVNAHSNKGLSKEQKTFLEQVAKKLCSHPLQPQNLVNKAGKTPLFLAVEARNLTIFKILLPKTTNFSGSNKNNNTLFHLMVNNPSMIKAFIAAIKKGQIDLNYIQPCNSLNKDKNTALDLASELTNLALKDTYIQYIDVLYTYGKTPPMRDLIKIGKIKEIEAADVAKLKDKTCAICQDDIENKLVRVQACGHHFHGHCFNKNVYMCTILSQKNLFCPV
ncbi:ankyrin repeat domain-containing protein [Cardinium endosymbiont of Nabis limbatus]|uniref:ankyrin repeat domain-containing protein n=1 Tax=Cardinium endosymbiont of Nabis limbatus TaxID=3066217 RepID=UPI003AF36254